MRTLKSEGNPGWAAFGSLWPRSVLCIGAHCDDIEIGCAGLLLLLQRECPGTRFTWAVFSGDDDREQETRSAANLIHGQSGHAVDVLRFKVSHFPYEGDAIKRAFEGLKQRHQPDLILTHFLHDRHQDHRVMAELTWNTFRRHTILEYEIPKYEGDLGQPNFFVPLDGSLVDQKVEILMRCFPSQRTRQWFDPETFRGLMRIRGIECNSESGYAEAFHARKIVARVRSTAADPQDDQRGAL